MPIPGPLVLEKLMDGGQKGVRRPVNPRLPLLIAVLCAAIVVVLTWCDGSSNRIANDFSAAAQISLSNHVNTVSFSAVTQFKWDKVYIFTPYTGQTEIDTALGYHWSSSAKNRIAESETESLIVFTRNGKVVQYVEFPRSLGSFESSLTYPGMSLPFGADIFTATQDKKDGGVIYIPRSAGKLQ